MSAHRVAVVGGGPAGLMAAEVLATAGVQVTVLEQMASVGRKLLVAGRGGLNLTHTEGRDAFLNRYGAARPRLEAAIDAFGPDDLRAWCASLGQETFVGSSGRVFPADFRATPLLRGWKQRLDDLGVEIRVRTPWTGWDSTPDADAVVLAMGGASWPRTGSDGSWLEPIVKSGIGVNPLQPANCGFDVAWTPAFRDRFAATPLKNVALSFGGVVSRGDPIVSLHGIEGGPVYALSAALRNAIAKKGNATLVCDLLPDLKHSAIEARLKNSRSGDSMSSTLKRLGLAPIAIGLLREAMANQLPTDPREMTTLVKATPIRLVSPRPIARAISTAGGIAFDEIDETYMLRSHPGTFAAGEMLDWEAPTGGYLLQATFSTAVAAARGVLAWLG